MGDIDWRVLKTSQAWLAQGRQPVLVTVARTWGSSPRPPGAMMVIDSGGRTVGSVSGGCIEGAVIEEALGRRASTSRPWMEQVIVRRTPEACEAGDEFELRVGLYEAGGSGGRLAILGRDDGTRRIRLGKVRVLEDRSIQWMPEPETVDEFATRVNMQAKPIDFGWVVTAGSLKAERQPEAVLLTPLPNEKAGQRYQIRSDRFPWPTAIPKRIVAIRESGEVLWDRPLADDGTFQHDEQAFAYRLEE